MVGSLMKKNQSKNIYDKYITIENIYNTWLVVKKTCKNREEVFNFSLNLNSNINNIYRVLKTKCYVPSKYRTFMIFEPKARLVMSQTVFDKIVNHFVANFYLIPFLDKKLIDSNVATRKYKGSFYAINLLKNYFNKLMINNPDKEIYCLKLDISKYFYSIDHEILIRMLEKNILDKDVINLIKIIIAETNNDYVNKNIRFYNNTCGTDIPYYNNNRGLSIGAMTSQFLAIFYLSELDHYIKEKLKCKYYIRYMDDFLILDTDKDKLKKYLELIKDEILKLNLSINNKSNIYRSSVGFVFLGYKFKIINNKLNVSFYKKTFLKIKKKLLILKDKDLFMYNRSLSSYYGYFKSVYKLEERSFKMRSIDVFKSYKIKYPNMLIIVKEGIFYKSYEKDSVILWYLFDYKINNGVVAFGTTPYDKVISKLRKIELGFVVVDKSGEILKYDADDKVYLTYYDLASKSIEKKKMENDLVEKVKLVFSKSLDNYDKINKYLDSLL